MALTVEELEEILAQFLLRRPPQLMERRAWSMVCLGREVPYRTYYILGTDHYLFRNMAIQDPRHNLDHYMVLVCLHSALLREHTEYLGRRMRLPL